MKALLKTKVLALTASIALLGGTAFVASGSTGAYFSDTHTGNVGGTVGSILLAPDSSTSIAFSNLLPGTAQTLTVSYHNSGTSNEDVYLTFPNVTALSALNNLGRYGSVIVAANGTWSPNAPVFTSYNLDDNSTRCGGFSSLNQDPTNASTPCWPLAGPIKIASDVPPTGGGNFTFTFEYAPALTGNGPAYWNTFPLPGYNNDGLDYAGCVAATDASGNLCTNNQFTINTNDGSGHGLPYDLVATQVGVTPGQVGSKF